MGQVSVKFLPRPKKTIAQILAIATCIYTISLLSWPGQDFSDFDKMVFYQLNENHYGKVPLDKLEEALPELSWPKYQGYDNRHVTPETNPPDELLLERIRFAEKHQKQPLIRLDNDGKPTERHPWKFEKIIHQSWIDENIPGQTAKWVKKWLILHPDWTYMFWTDETARDFISLHFPSLLPAYDSWSLPVAKADMFRYVVLYAMGGVWADLDMEALRPIDQIRDWSSCILSREPDVQVYVMSDFMPCWGNNMTFTCNAFMACRSHHPFLHYLIARTVQNSPFITKQECTLNRVILCTGPWMMSFAYAFYIRSVPEELRKKNKELDVLCPHYEIFLPTFDDSRLDLVKSQCKQIIRRADYKKKKLQIGLCNFYARNDYINQPTRRSITTHHWFHSYHFDVTKNSVDVSVITKPLFWTPETDHLYHVCMTDQCIDDER